MKMILRWISDERWIEVAQYRLQCRALVLPGGLLHYFTQKLTVTLPEDQYTCLILYGAIILRTRNVLHKSCREYQNTNLM